jgi:hypothetical protein
VACAEPDEDQSQPSKPGECNKPDSADVLFGRGSKLLQCAGFCCAFASLLLLGISHAKAVLPTPAMNRWVEAHIYTQGGNQDFLKLVRNNANRLRIADKSERTRIADDLVQTLRLEGRRFLQFHRGDNVWRDVGNERARQKVIQTWRDSATSNAADSDVDLPSDLLKVSLSIVPRCRYLGLETAFALTCISCTSCPPQTVLKLGGGKHIEEALVVRLVEVARVRHCGFPRSSFFLCHFQAPLPILPARGAPATTSFSFGSGHATGDLRDNPLEPAAALAIATAKSCDRDESNQSDLPLDSKPMAVSAASRNDEFCEPPDDYVLHIYSA